MTYPKLPESIQHPGEHVNLRDLWIEVCRELADSEYRNRTHMNRKTYIAGCHGPLCLKATRDYARRRVRSEGRQSYKSIEPVLNFFHQEAMKKIQNDEQALLGRLIS